MILLPARKVQLKKGLPQKGDPYSVCSECRNHKLTDDDTCLEMEAALRDWLFGCNIWGTSMIVGLPDYGDTPVDPHSSERPSKEAVYL